MVVSNKAVRVLLAAVVPVLCHLDMDFWLVPVPPPPKGPGVWWLGVNAGGEEGAKKVLLDDPLVSGAP